MRETEDDLQRLQAQIDATYRAAGAHLRSIHTEATRLAARELVDELDGMRLLVLATVTSSGRPLTGPVDGILYRGAWMFGSSPTSVRARHLAARPDVSATHLRGEELVCTVHGRALPIDPRTHDDGGFVEVARSVYGDDWESWGLDAPYWRIEADRVLAARTSLLMDTPATPPA